MQGGRGRGEGVESPMLLAKRGIMCLGSSHVEGHRIHASQLVWRGYEHVSRS